MKDYMTVSLRMLKVHSQKLDDIAAHDGVKKSVLIRRAVIKLLNARKVVLYPHNYPCTCNAAKVDRYGDPQICDRNHDPKPRE